MYTANGLQPNYHKTLITLFNNDKGTAWTEVRHIPAVKWHPWMCTECNAKYRGAYVLYMHDFPIYTICIDPNQCK